MLLTILYLGFSLGISIFGYIVFFKCNHCWKKATVKSIWYCEKCSKQVEESELDG